MNRKAFSLIELLAAGMVMVISAACFCGSLQQCRRFYARAEKRERSLAASAGRLERVSALPFADLPSMNGSSFEGAIISVATLATDLLRIEVDGLVTLRAKTE